MLLAFLYTRHESKFPLPLVKANTTTTATSSTMVPDLNNVVVLLSIMLLQHTFRVSFQMKWSTFSKYLWIGFYHIYFSTARAHYIIQSCQAVNGVNLSLFFMRKCFWPQSRGGTVAPIGPPCGAWRGEVRGHSTTLWLVEGMRLWLMLECRRVEPYPFHHEVSVKVWCCIMYIHPMHGHTHKHTFFS